MVLRRKPEPHEAIEILDSSTPYKGYFEIDRYRLRHRRFNGSWSEAMTREVFERGHAVGVLPYDASRDEVVLVEQFRIGAYAAGTAPWQLEVVAGIVEAGESAEEVARREAMEEAGLQVGGLEPIGRFLVSPGGASETFQLFCAPVDAESAGGLHGLSDEHEDIKVHVVGRAEARNMLDAGGITSVPAVIALQWLLLNHERLQRAWRGSTSPQAPIQAD